MPHVCHVCTQASVPRKRPGSANIRSGEREDGQGKYEKGDEGAYPEVLVLGYAARCTGATVAPWRGAGPSSCVRPHCAQEPSDALTVREKLSGTLALSTLHLGQGAG